MNTKNNKRWGSADFQSFFKTLFKILSCVMN